MPRPALNDERFESVTVQHSDPERTQTDGGEDGDTQQRESTERERDDSKKIVSNLLLQSACTAQAPHDSQPWTSAVFGLYCFTPYDW